MKLLDIIETPWAVYSVMFSRDCNRLAIGGGTWYGNGGIMLIDVRSGDANVLSCAELLPSERPSAPTVSGLCFSDDDGHLATSMWASRQHYAPTELFQVKRLDVTHMTSASVRTCRDFRGMGPCPTGVLFHRGSVITRHHGGDPKDVIAIDPLPEVAAIATDRPIQRFTHLRAIVARETVITETGGSRGVYERQPDGSLKKRIVEEGLVARALTGHAPDVVIPVEGGHRITAIACAGREDSFVTGGGHGEIDAWSWDERWIQERVQQRQPPRTVEWPGLKVPWVTYTPESIVGLVALSDRDGFASVDAGGRITIYEHSRRDYVWDIPVAGSPRTLAANPQKPWLAVGLKRGTFDNPASAVAIIEVE